MDVEKIAHDLAVAYAKSKFDRELASGTDFDHGLVPGEIKELEFLLDQFLFAYDYYQNMEEGDFRKRLEQN